MVSYPIGPDSQHPIEWDEDTEGIGYHEHILRPNPKVLLDIPETESGERRAGCLREAKVGDLEEREGHDIILNNGDECPGSIQPIRKKEECN